jgi:tetratricopeptide (TPR) repeat protein
LTLYKLKKFEEAVKDFDFIISKDPTNHTHYGLRGWCYFYQKSYPEAIADFTSLLKLSPNEPIFRRFRAAAYFYLDEYEKAIEDTTEEIKINKTPGNETYRIRANAYRRLGKNDLAEIDEQKFAELGGKMSELTIEKSVTISITATVYDAPRIKSIQQSIYKSIGEKNYDGAFKEVDDLIKNVPNEENTNIKSLIFTARGANYFSRGEYQKSLDDLNEALKINDKSSLAYQGRAATYRKLGKIKEAEADDAKLEELKSKQNERKNSGDRHNGQ